MDDIASVEWVTDGTEYIWHSDVDLVQFSELVPLLLRSDEVTVYLKSDVKIWGSKKCTQKEFNYLLAGLHNIMYHKGLRDYENLKEHRTEEATDGCGIPGGTVF